LSDIDFSEVGSIGLITLSRVQALNALTLPMIMAMQDMLIKWQSKESIHAIVIQASPGRAFCAGGDIRWLYDAGRQRHEDQRQFFWHEYRLNHFIHQLNKPYIALMDGVTMGGGVGISLHGKYPVASERFMFAMPETGIGFFPDIGASHLLSRCPNHFGTYLGLTGCRVGPYDALSLGLVKHVILAEHFQEVLASLVALDLSKDAHQQVSSCLQQYQADIIDGPLDAIKLSVETCFEGHDMETIMERLSSRDDAFHRDTQALLLQKAPLSLKVTLAQLIKAKTKSLFECLQMDYCLVGHFMYGHDFYEGVRAVLVDKDKSPDWQPKSLAQVSDDLVASYFKSSHTDLLEL